MTDTSAPFDLATQYPGYVDRLFHVESGGDPNAVTGSNRGLGQFGPAEEARYGITDANRGSYNAQAAAVAREAAEHAGVLQKALGRPPTSGELYLTHQQGVAGGPALLTANPDQPAWMVVRPYYKSDAVARSAISGNIPSGSPLYRTDVNAITAGDFRNLWTSKFGGGGAAPIAGAAGIGSPPSMAAGAVPGGAVASAAGVSSAAAAPASPSPNENETAALMQAQRFLGPQETPLEPAAPLAPPINRARLRNVLAGQGSAGGPQLPPSVRQRLAALMGRTQG